MREKDILYQNNTAWVCMLNDAYYVMVDGITNASSDSAYAPDADGFEIAKARCDYLGRKGINNLNNLQRS